MVTSLRDAAAAHVRPDWIPALAELVGDAHVLTEMPDLWVYSRDRAPYATFHVRNANVPATLPCAVACPGSVAELAQVVRFARARRIPLIPFGAGSGVLGGALPLERELMVDLKRLNAILELNEIDGTVTVQAGMNGGQFEAALNRRGFTCGHLPQSLHMSTVGGWAACRGAGQNSTRFGKIEDIVVGLAAVMPDGRELRVRPVARRAVGPSIKDLMVGSEGIFGILTEITLRVWRLPEARLGVVLAFPSLQAGLDAMRTIMQHELRPAVVRLYDREESDQRTAGIAAFAERPFLAIMEFSGTRRLAEVEHGLAMEIVETHGGSRTDDAPYLHWQQHRYESYSPKWQHSDHSMDTIEITGPWSRLPAMYERIRREVLGVCEGMYFGTHWSHAYPEGACQYMTLRLPPMPHADTLRLHRRAWDLAERACLELGGSISHHHGAGLFRNPWLRTELGVGLEMLQAVKDHLDPDNLFVPGKLGMRARPGAVDIESTEDAS
ncbi:MAG: FAD-binding oxidoreductase [Burkholderiales bacterium]|nr:MAG: FAD-binding oxidoreductase [Burkholderiales bacterium]